MTFTKISVLIPTRHRVQRLRTLLASYALTVDNPGTVELVFRADQDDWDTLAFLSSQEQKTVMGPRLQGYRSLPAFFNEMYAASTGDVLMCGNDDMVFETAGWAGLVLETANDYPDGLFDIGVHTHNETHYPFSITSRAVADRLGFLWDPSIFWGDIYLRDIMSAFGRAVMLPEVEVTHDWAGHNPDATFLEGDQNDIMRRDPAYWTGTHARAVSEAIGRLRGMHNA